MLRSIAIRCAKINIELFDMLCTLYLVAPDFVVRNYVHVIVQSLCPYVYVFSDNLILRLFSLSRAINNTKREVFVLFAMQFNKSPDFLQAIALIFMYA